MVGGDKGDRAEERREAEHVAVPFRRPTGTARGLGVAGRPHRIPMTGVTNLLAAIQALELRRWSALTSYGLPDSIRYREKCIG